jgi:hypothetical protein
VQYGGAERDRTVDLLNAIQALSQLSYSPTAESLLLKTEAVSEPATCRFDRSPN